MSFEKIFHENTSLKNVKVLIDGVEIIKDDIVSISTKQSLNDFGIVGSLKMKDSFDINNAKMITLNGDNLITISMTDFLENKSLRTYRIINVSIDPALEQFKVYNFEFVDVISFELQNAYLSKSFNDTPINAFKSYLTHLKIDKLLSADKLVTDIVDTSTKDSFVVPQNVSVLDFFIDRFQQENIRIWQDRFGIHAKEIKIADLTVGTDRNGDNVLYTNETLNNLYIYKIHDIHEVKNSIGENNYNLPIQRTYRFSTNKEIIDTTKNLKDELTNFKLGTLNASTLQLTTGERYTTQEVTTTGNQTFDLFNEYIPNNKCIIAVPGDLQNSNCCQLADLKLRGNPIISDSILKGDVLSSGKYFIGAVSDTIIGDKLIHKLSLYRMDAKEPR